jgi:tRNA (guanine-N7-)-methyltransferase
VDSPPATDRRGRIPSYKVRRGRLGPTSADALDRLLPRWGVPVDGRPLDPGALFGRRAPLVLDIGCGDGEATVALAAARPGADVVAVDVHTPGLGALLRRLEAAGLTNARVAEGDAVVVLEDMLAPGALDEVRVLFPDPWPKARHHKRRLVTPAFARLVAGRLRPGGRLHVATDCADYAAQVLAVVAGCDALEGGAVPRPDRPVTRFEQRAHRAGRPVVDVVAVRRWGPSR